MHKNMGFQLNKYFFSRKKLFDGEIVGDIIKK